MNLSTNMERKQMVLQHIRMTNYRYRLYTYSIKSFGILIWLLPLLVIIGKLLNHAVSGRPFQRHECGATLLICLMLVGVFVFAKWFLQALVLRMMRGGFTQDNQVESIALTEDGAILYAHNGPNGKQHTEERIYAKRVTIDTELQCVVFYGKIVIYKFRVNDPITPVQEKSIVTLYDYFTPSLIQSVQKMHFEGGIQYGRLS